MEHQLRKLQFYNSVGGWVFQRRLCEELEHKGWSVQDISSLHASEYRATASTLSRWHKRWKTYPGFGLKIIRRCRQTNSNTTRIVTSNPFFAPWLARVVSPKSIPVIHLLYDLFPDALEMTGMLRRDAFLSSVIQSLTRSMLSKCDTTVFLGERLRQHAEDRYGPAKLARVIPVGADGKPFSTYPPRMIPENEAVTFLYCGHMGKMHDFETLAQALSAPTAMRTEQQRWIFHSSGDGFRRLRDLIETRVDRESVSFSPPVDDHRWTRLMRNSHVSVVTIAPQAENILLPSKTYSSLVAGQAILAVCSSNSDLADMLVEHRCGWVVEPGDVKRLQQTVQAIVENRQMLHETRMRAFRAGQQFFDMNPVADLWDELLEELDPARCK